MARPEPRPGEAYRLREAKRGADGMQHMVPFPADQRLFATYREATAAAKSHRGKCPSVVTQAIIIDASGNLIFPPDDLPVLSRGRWHVAPTLWSGPAAKTGRKPQRRPLGTTGPDAGPPRPAGP